MKFLSFFILFIFSIFLAGCESSDDSVLSTNNLIKVSSDSSNARFDVGTDLLDLDDVIVANKIIDGVSGGEINIDTVLVDALGHTLSISARLKIDSNSFNDVKMIRMIANSNDASIQFFPEMTFNKPVKLNLLYSGIDLANLGFEWNSKAEFVYINNNGEIEPVQNNFCTINWPQQSLQVSNAKLLHFSRYVFVRKSL